MSIHPSLRGVDTLQGERSVLTRFERVQRMVKEGKLSLEQGDSPYGLPKMRTKFKVASGKKAKALAKEGEEGEEGEEAEKPADE